MGREKEQAIMIVEDKYIHLENWTLTDETEADIKTVLTKNKLNNLIVKATEKDNDLALAEMLNPVLAESNGLVSFYGTKQLQKQLDEHNLTFVISLPTQHEAVEAIMMNILENEFLSGTE